MGSSVRGNANKNKASMKRCLLDLRNILLLVGIFFLATWYAILLTYLLTSYRGPKGGVDYLAHYSAGYIIR